ncbi:MAG: hypothetical protein ICV53_08295 [Flavisolibacter sp.]|nr:hypothetical protein [Flavisolibacter sp.]
MNDDLHNIDRLFHKAMEGGEETPPPGLWEKIDKDLDKRNIVSIYKKYTDLKRVAIILFFVACAAGLYALHIHYTSRELANANRKATIKNNHTKTSIATSDAKNSVAGKQGNTVTKTPVEKVAEPSENVPVRTQRKNAENGVENKPIPVPDKLNTSSIAQTSLPKNKIARDKKLHSNPNRTIEKELTQADIAISENKQKPDDESSVPLPYTKEIDNGQTLKEGFSFSPVINPSFTDISHPITVSPPPIQLSPVSVALFISPEWASNHIERGSLGSPQGPGRDHFSHKEKYVSSLSTGFLLDYSMSQKWKLESGLTFTSSTIEIPTKTIYAQRDNRGAIRYRLNCSTGYSYVSAKSGTTPAIGDSIKIHSSRNTLQYVAVPLALKYNIILGRFNLNPTFGFAAHFLTKGTIETTFANSAGEKTTTRDIKGLKSGYFSSLLAVSAEYNLSRTMAVNVMPTAKMALSSINNDGPVQSFPRSFGVAVGLRYKF